MGRGLHRILLLLLLMLAGPHLSAQYFFVLDPDDANAYRAWTEKTYSYTVKLSAPTYAGQVSSHTVRQASEVPTPEVDPVRSAGPASLWGIRVPEWVRSMVTNPFTGAGTDSRNETLYKMWQGLSMYQRSRAVLRTAGLIRASLNGLRFEIDGWRMLNNILAFENTDENGRKLGMMTFSVVPKGKGTLDEIERVFQDDTIYHDPAWKDRLKIVVPTGSGRSLLDFLPIVDYIDDGSIDRKKIIGPNGEPLDEKPEDAIGRWLEAVDRGARIATEEIAALRTYAGMKRNRAKKDAMSPYVLANQMIQMSRQTRAKYRSIEALRSLLEGRDIGEIAAEHDAMQRAAEKDARAAYAQAEMHVTFYANIGVQADNAVAGLIDPERMKDIDLLEKLLIKYLDDNNKDEILRDGKEGWDMIKKVAPQYLSYLPEPVQNAFGSMQEAANDFKMNNPWIGVVTQAWDFYSTKNNYDPNKSDLDSKSPVTALMKQYQAKMLAIRMGYHLWEELKAIRNLMALKEQHDMAQRGTGSSHQVQQAYERAMALAREREIGLKKLKFYNQKLSGWLG